MSALARPSVLAALATAAALLLHPALGARAWLPGHELLPTALVALCAAALAARAVSGREPAAITVAAGALVLLLGVALDGVRGTQGTLGLALGRASNTFEEQSPSGRALGLRPLGFSVGFERATPDGGVALAVPGLAAPIEVPRAGAAEIGGYRLAQPRLRLTGGVARLRVAMSDGKRTEVVDLVPGQPTQAAGFLLSVSEYFPDFALDERQQPFSRSLEPRNPAALIDIEKDGARHRAFVLRSMPGVHRVEPLGLTFSMLDLEPEQSVEIAVHHEPFAWLVLGGGVLAGAGLLLLALRRPATAEAAAGPDSVALAGALLSATLVLADGAHVLGWQYAVRSSGGRAPLPGVGVLLGVALLLSLAGTLLRAASVLAGGVPATLPRLALALGAACAGAGTVLAAARVAALSQATPAAWAGVAGLAAAVLMLAAVLWLTRGDRGDADVLATVLSWLAPAVVFGAVVLGWLGVAAHGTYASPPAAAAFACALLGLAALERTSLAAPRRLLFLAATLALSLGVGL